MKKFLSVVLVIVLSLGCFSMMSFAEETDTVEHLTEVPDGYVGIYNKDDLDNIKLNMSGKYILMNDIVFEDSDYVKGGSFYNSGKGWEPIGTTPTPFKGILDGNNYRIKNLYINNPTQDYIGLFGYVRSATITKVSLENANIIGMEYVGGIVGYSYDVTTVSYCNVQGYVSGENYIGGIVGYGYCYDYLSSYNYIKFCSNSSSVVAKNSYAGGIVGYSTGYSVSHCSEVRNCYNIGDISAKSYLGGIVGCAGNSKVYYCYSMGTITGKSSYGGCFGEAPYNYSFCYYLDEAIENPTCTTGIPKSEDQLKKASTFEQWDFKTIWTTKGREDYPYPEIIGSHPVLPEDGMHKHEYTSEVTTLATHLADGIMTYTCECGDTYTEVIEKISDHSYEAVVTAPTCTAKGYTTYICECNDSYIADYIDAKGHDFKATVTEPDCTEFGYTTFVCECGESYISEYVNANGHRYISEVTKEATHLEKGEMTYTCECGDTYTRTTDKTVTHDFKAVVTEPTCTEYGFTTYTCECGESYIKDYVNATNHIDNNGDYKCDYNCGYEFDRPADPTPSTPDTPSDPADDCSCNCHKGGIAGFFFKIINFFQKLFGMNKVCACGVAHY